MTMNAHSDQNHYYCYQNPIILTKDDVIFAGRGRQFVHHPGNILFNNIVKSHLHNFCNLSKESKSVVSPWARKGDDSPGSTELSTAMSPGTCVSAVSGGSDLV